MVRPPESMRLGAQPANWRDDQPTPEEALRDMVAAREYGPTELGLSYRTCDVCGDQLRHGSLADRQHACGDPAPGPPPAQIRDPAKQIVALHRRLADTEARLAAAEARLAAGDDGEPSDGSGHAGTMTTAEAAERLGVTPRAIRRACAEGRLAGAKHGGVWLLEVAR